MKKIIAGASAAAVLSLSIGLLPAAATGSDIPSYYPASPQNGVSIQEVLDGGWEICYEGDYNLDNVPLYGADGILSELCTGDYLMLAGYFDVSSDEFAVLAAAPREDVIYDVGTAPDAYHEAHGTRWYFSPERSWGFVSTSEIPNRYTCDYGRVFTPQTLCWHTDGEYGYMQGGYLLAGVDGLNGSTTATKVVLQFGASEPESTPYTGPVVHNSPVVTSSGGTFTLRGSSLQGVTAASVAGKNAAIESQSASALTLRAPSDLEQGIYDVVLTYGNAQSVVVQNGLEIKNNLKVWTKLRADGTLKIYAKNIVGEGKVQFFHNGKEVAWIRAVDALDPKLSTSNGSNYLVRTRALVSGQNTFEIYVNGVRILRNVYSK